MRLLILLCVILVTSCGSIERASAKTVWTRESLIEKIREMAGKKSVDPNLALAIVQTESNFNIQALRTEPHLKTASVGLFQVLHATARGEFGFKGTIDQLRSPLTNIRIGLEYLARCVDANQNLDLKWVACCYNAGLYVKPAKCGRMKQVAAYHKKLEAHFEGWSNVD